MHILLNDGQLFVKSMFASKSFIRKIGPKSIKPKVIYYPILRYHFNNFNTDAQHTHTLTIHACGRFDHTRN